MKSTILASTIAMAIVCGTGQCIGAVLTTIQHNLNQPVNGQTLRVRWDGNLPTGVKQVFLWDGDRGIVRPISEELPDNVHEFEWPVPPDVMPGNRYRVKVCGPDNQSVAEFSAGFFSLQGLQPFVASVIIDNKSAEFRCAPIPARDVVKISWNPTVTIVKAELLDATYATMATTNVAEGTSTVDLALDHIPSGLAIVRITSSDGQTVSQPLLVVH